MSLFPKEIEFFPKEFKFHFTSSGQARRSACTPARGKFTWVRWNQGFVLELDWGKISLAGEPGGRRAALGQVWGCGYSPGQWQWHQLRHRPQWTRDRTCRTRKEQHTGWALMGLHLLFLLQSCFLWGCVPVCTPFKSLSEAWLAAEKHNLGVF